MITISDKAVQEVSHIITEQKLEGKIYLRLRILGGGCSGFQTKLDLDTEVNEKVDNIFQANGIDVVIDKRSSLYTEGAKIDFHSDINKRGFVVDIPGSKGKCGCGSSFSL